MWKNALTRALGSAGALAALVAVLEAGKKWS